jgi:cystathionine beta-lyase/cystathionine gamma-synthase
VGAVPSPFDCFLALRGTKTLAVRMRQHEENTRHIAPFLLEQAGVEKVYYPGFEDHPQHQLALRQQRGFGAIISFDVGSLERADKLLQAVRVFTLAESLGGVESLISHPSSMTHGSVPVEDKIKLGVTDGLVRISVGIEDVEDLEADLAGAIASL